MSVQISTYKIELLGMTINAEVSEKSVKINVDVPNGSVADYVSKLLAKFASTSVTVCEAKQPQQSAMTQPTTAQQPASQPLTASPIDDIKLPTLNGAPTSPPDLGQINHLGEKSEAVLAVGAQAADIVSQQKPVLMNSQPGVPTQLTVAPAAVVDNSQVMQQSIQQVTQQLPAGDPRQLGPTEQALLQNHFNVTNAAAQSGKVCGLSTVEVSPLSQVQAAKLEQVEAAIRKIDAANPEALRKKLLGTFPPTVSQVIGALSEDGVRTLTKNKIIDQSKA